MEVMPELNTHTQLQQTKDDVREIKSTLGKQLKWVRAKMQEELSALKSILHTKDELINSLKEKLSLSHSLVN